MRAAHIGILLAAASSLAGCSGGGGGSGGSTTPPSGAQPPGWAVAYGGVGLDRANAMTVTKAGGFVLAGGTASSDLGRVDGHVARIDADGTLVWEYAYGGPLWDELVAVAERPGGGFVVAGSTESFGAGGRDLWVMRLDENGSKLWERVLGGPASDEASALAVDADGNTVVAGVVRRSGADEPDALLVKLDALGSIVWQRFYGLPGSDRAERFEDVRTTPDGGFVAVGAIRGWGTGWDAWVVKLDASGDIEWQRAFDSAVVVSEDWGTSVATTDDGGYLVGGRVVDSASAGSDPWVLRLDSEGTVIWGRTFEFSPSSEAFEGAPSVGTVDGECVVALTETQPFGPSHGWVARLGAGGLVVWQQRFGVGAEGLRAFTLTAEGQGAACGETRSYGAGGADALLFTLPLDGTWKAACGLVSDGAAVSALDHGVSVETLVPAGDPALALVADAGIQKAMQSTVTELCAAP
ncbi:MAG: hypothetical protein O7B99_12000 [Planctomycetota bacterium]|nr:hypothetical protein [Planctomycetota bacterium]